METKTERLNNIFLSHVNGQNKQMVRQMEEYGLYDVLPDLKDYLLGLYEEDICYQYAYKMAKIYFRITNR